MQKAILIHCRCCFAVSKHAKLERRYEYQVVLTAVQQNGNAFKQLGMWDPDDPAMKNAWKSVKNSWKSHKKRGEFLWFICDRHIMSHLCHDQLCWIKSPGRLRTGFAPKGGPWHWETDLVFQRGHQHIRSPLTRIWTRTGYASCRMPRDDSSSPGGSFLRPPRSAPTSWSTCLGRSSQTQIHSATSADFVISIVIRGHERSLQHFAVWFPMVSPAAVGVPSSSNRQDLCVFASAYCFRSGGSDDPLWCPGESDVGRHRKTLNQFEPWGKASKGENHYLKFGKVNIIDRLFRKTSVWIICSISTVLNCSAGQRGGSLEDLRRKTWRSVAEELFAEWNQSADANGHGEGHWRRALKAASNFVFCFGFCF